MSTQQSTTSSQDTNLRFDPGSLSLYKGLTGAGGKVLQGYMNDPFGNAFYRMGAGQTAKGALQLGNQNMDMIRQLFRTSGMGGQAGQGWMGAQLARTGRANQSLWSQGQISNIMSALQRQIGATGMGMSYSPLMTGQSAQGKQTTETSGLGTWLPQVLGAGLGMATGMATMGAGGGGGNGFFNAMTGKPSTAMSVASNPAGMAGMAAPMGMSGLTGSVPGTLGGMSLPPSFFQNYQ